jgi:type IV secretory pathway VirJ component
LAQRGMLVARIDVDRYLRKHRDMPAGQCALLDNQVEHLADRLLRREGIDQYLQPMLLGTGRGAGLVQQVLDSADPDVLAGAIVDDAAAPTQLPQCAAGMPDEHHGFLVAAGHTPSSLALAADAHLPRQRGGALPGLPLVEMPAPGRRLAILMSGDGGWHYLDKGVASQLRRAGVSVLGWNSLRYFWAPKTPSRPRPISPASLPPIAQTGMPTKWR